MSSTLKKVILFVGIISMVLFLGLVSAAWYMGMFSSVNITTGEKGPYYYIYLEHQGPYYQITDKIDKVDKYLSEESIERAYPASIYFDNPANIPEDQLKSYGGFMVKDSINVYPPFYFKRIDFRKVIIASIEAHPMVAPFKVYPAFEEWIGNNQNFEIIGPPMELYLTGGFVEVHFPYQEKN